MKKILFVDDELAVLEGLRRVLRCQRHEWDMTFVDRGQAALEELSTSTYDVIVSDMRMPGMDGAALLARVQEQHPGVVRLILSGYSALEAVLRAVPVAHQFLNKPCEAAVLQEVISRTCALQALLEHDALREVVGKVESLPVLPKVYHSLVVAMQDADVGIDDVVPIIEQDPAITAKILQLVNSAFFGLSRTISTLRDAARYLGLNMLRDLTLSMEVFRTFEGEAPPHGFSFEDEQAHALLSARIARLLPDDKLVGENAFVAAMLHDIGKLVIATKMPEEYRRVVAACAESLQPIYAVEEHVIGVSHAEIGGYLLGIWGLPYPIVEAVANHHRPARVEHTSFDAVGAVHVADALAREVMSLTGDCDEGLDLDYLEAQGVLDELPRWRELAHKQACLLELAG